MATLNRRAFLIRSSGVVATAGAAAAIPALLPTLAGADTTKPAPLGHPAGSSDATTGPMTEPLVAHIRDLSTGEIGLFSGEQEFVIHDRQVARSLFDAVK